MRIGFFIDAWHPGAGTENQLRGILRHLDPRRVEARLFTLREPIAEADRHQVGWPTECLGVRKLASFDSMRKLLRFARRLRRERFDILMLYFNDTNLFIGASAAMAGTGIRVVNRRDMGYWYEPGLLRALRFVNRGTQYFLVNSRAVKETVAAQERFPAERIAVIPNALWDAQARSQQPLSRRELGIPESARIVGIVANLRPVKRIDRFVTMASRVVETHPETHFLIAGQGEEERKLRAQVREFGLTSRVHFLGRVDEVERLLPLLEVGVLTSESEGLSNALIEYAKAGVPAVAFAVGGNREIVEDGSSGCLVPDGDVESLAAAVTLLLSEDDLRCRFGAEAKRVATERFDPNAILAETMAFFETILAAGRNFARFDRVDSSR
jgi:glycosyltransferase involved in cell wall biosynthesis